MTLARKRVPFSIRDYLTAVEKDEEKKNEYRKKRSEEKGKNGETRGERQTGVKKKMKKKTPTSIENLREGMTARILLCRFCCHKVVIKDTLTRQTWQTFAVHLC